MGLDFSHCEAHWSYSGFMHFRTRLAAEAGIALHCMESFAYTMLGEKCEKIVLYLFNEKESRSEGIVGIQPVIKWSSVQGEIVPFLNHSDCDGEMSPNECEVTAPIIRELVASWPDDDYDKIQALELVEGMEEAARNGECLLFS